MPIMCTERRSVMKQMWKFAFVDNVSRNEYFVADRNYTGFADV